MTGKRLIGWQGRARAGRLRRVAAMRKAREIVAHVEPAQAFGVMGVGLRTIVLGMLEGQGVEVDLLGPAVGLVGHRAAAAPAEETPDPGRGRSEEHTSELQSLMRISYAVFCLKKKKQKH